MRICYLADGTSLHTQRWVNYFVRKGHEVHLISYRFRAGYDERLKQHTLTRLPPKSCGVSRYPSGILGLFQIRQLLGQMKPDILDAHYITVNGYLAAFSGFHPLILSAWGSDILISSRQSSLHRFLISKSLKKADGIICVSSAMKEEIVKLGASPDMVTVTPIGVDTAEFSPKQKDGRVIPELGVADSSPVVISTRNLEPLYGVITLIKAIPLVLRKVPEAQFVIIGDGAQRNILENEVKSQGVSGNTTFVGWVQHGRLPRYLAASDVYVSTSLSDGASISLMEAMASGLAPVVTDIPANRSWISDGESGLLFPVRDAEALAERIVYLIEHKEVRKRFGNVSREIVTERAEHKKEMDRVESIYQGLLK